MPQIREWPGGRVITQLGNSDYVLKTLKFESKGLHKTGSINRDDIEDDKLGLYEPRIRLMAHGAATHPDELIFALLTKGFDMLCFDQGETSFRPRRNFFDTNHIYVGANGVETSVSNIQAGTDPTWFLLDTSRPVKPMVSAPA